MFITLKSSSSQQNAGNGGVMMEQVALRNASPAAGTDRARSSRKPACTACQSKKLRCSGGTRTCDRCKARSIPCVFPPSNSGPSRHRNSRPPSFSTSISGLAWQNHQTPAAEHGGDKMRSPTSTRSENTPTVASGRGPPTEDTTILGGDWSDLTVENIDLHLDDIGADDFSLDTQAMMATMNGGARNDSFSGDGLPQALGMQGPSQLNLLSLDVPQMPPTHPGTQPRTQSAIPAEVAQIQANTGPTHCTCINDMVRVVQQLDDDEFRITTLSLDQVLQVQKWLIFQCCKPLDCPSCMGPPAVHTVLLIICDRLTEMFECVHKRIKRATASLPGLGGRNSSEDGQTPGMLSDDSAYASESPTTGGAGEMTIAQLFCSSSGRVQNGVRCNPLIFSGEFRSQYSDEEQVHMIRVLLQLQIRNFRQLLVRAESMSQSQGSQARKSKVKSYITRLTKAATAIDEALQVVLQAVPVG